MWLWMWPICLHQQSTAGGLTQNNEKELKRKWSGKINAKTSATTELGLKCDEKRSGTVQLQNEDAQMHTCTTHIESRQPSASICNQVEKQKWWGRLSPPPQRFGTALGYHLTDRLVPLILIKIGYCIYWHPVSQWQRGLQVQGSAVVLFTGKMTCSNQSGISRYSTLPLMRRSSRPSGWNGPR